MAYMPSKPIMAKYEAAKEALEKAGATLVAKEWPSESGCPAEGAYALNSKSETLNLLCTLKKTQKD